eukprot:GAFH01004512.1.p2 GENE.GAFH01004512.1~~GAFH01004512.1.p2  ORF type:complete len:215 (+),score=35.64 GAFH01004512.1:23-646(+)
MTRESKTPVAGELLVRRTASRPSSESGESQDDQFAVILESKPMKICNIITSVLISLVVVANIILLALLIPSASMGTSECSWWRAGMPLLALGIILLILAVINLAFLIVYVVLRIRRSKADDFSTDDVITTKRKVVPIISVIFALCNFTHLGVSILLLIHGFIPSEVTTTCAMAPLYAKVAGLVGCAVLPLSWWEAWFPLKCGSDLAD